MNLSRKARRILTEVVDEMHIMAASIMCICFVIAMFLPSEYAIQLGMLGAVVCMTISVLSVIPMLILFFHNSGIF